MNENINLCNILKGHEGEIFYSIVLDYVKLHKVSNNTLVILALKHNSIGFEVDAKEIVADLFPSKDQRDWNKWVEEQKSKVPKTWSDLSNNFTSRINAIRDVVDYGVSDKHTPIEKSALALLKIHQLIEVGYGGNITNKEWKNDNTLKYIISYDAQDNKFNICPKCILKNTIAFHTKEQANEFLSHSENIQLLKNYFMI